LDPSDGGKNFLLRDKRNKNGEWMETRLAEGPLWPQGPSWLAPGLILENTLVILRGVVRQKIVFPYQRRSKKRSLQGQASTDEEE